MRRMELLRPPTPQGNPLPRILTLLQRCEEVKILYCIQPYLQQATIASRKCLHKGSGVFSFEEKTFMGVFNVRVVLTKSHCWATFLSDSRLLFEQGTRSPGLICPRPHRELPACRETSRVSRVHLVFDFLDGAARNSVNEFKMQYEEELGILVAAEGLESCKSPSSPVSCLHHQRFGGTGLTPARGNGQSASPQALAPLDQKQRDTTSPNVHSSKQDQI